MKEFKKARTPEQMGSDPDFPIHNLLKLYGDLCYSPPWIECRYPSYHDRWKCGETAYGLAEHLVDQLSGYLLQKINAEGTDYLHRILDLKMYKWCLRPSNGRWLYQVDVPIEAMKAKEGAGILLISMDWVRGQLRYYYWPADFVGKRGGTGRYASETRLQKEIPVGDENKERAIQAFREGPHKFHEYEYPTLESAIEAALQDPNTLVDKRVVA